MRSACVHECVRVRARARATCSYKHDHMGLPIRVGVLMLIPTIDYETGGDDRPELPPSWNFRDS